MSRAQELLDRHNYYSDRRVIDSMQNACWKVVSSNDTETVIQVTRMSEEGEETEDVYKVRTSYEVCDRCNGSGRMVDPKYDSGGLTREDFDEDPDFAEAYFSGKCDVNCSTCKGKRVTLDTEQAFLDLPTDVQEYIREWDKDEAYSRAERLAELRMGC